MNFEYIRYILGSILIFQGGFMLIPSGVALIYKEHTGISFLISSTICLVIGILLTRKKPRNNAFYAKEGFFSVAICWVAFSVSGALPFIITQEIPSVTDALFEIVSGYTTTGSTILPDVEALSKCLLFWRSFTHWIGGMGVLVFVLCVLPLAGGNNMHLMRAESPGPSVGKLVPRIRSTAMILYGIYTALTVMECILLLLGGMSFFDAITTSFGTAGTGGFGIKNSSIADYNTFIQNVVAVFMVLFGVNFNIYFLLLVRKPKQALKSEEMCSYFGIILISTILIAINIKSSYASLGTSFQQAFFQVSSIITTTGFSTTDFNLWPTFSKTILVLLMFIGACGGSTGGGIKVSRIVIAWKNVRNEVASFIHPKSVHTVRMEGKKVSNDIVRSVNTYIVIYILVFVVSVLLISLEGFSLETSFTSVAATLNNIGPGLDGVGPLENFAGFSVFSKCILMFDMLAGRLELIPMVVLFSPRSWNANSQVSTAVTNLKF